MELLYYAYGCITGFSGARYRYKRGEHMPQLGALTTHIEQTIDDKHTGLKEQEDTRHAQWQQQLGHATPYLLAHVLMGPGAPKGQELEWKSFPVEPVELSGEMVPAQLVILGVTRLRSKRPFTYNAFNFSLALGEGRTSRLPQYMLGRIGIEDPRSSCNVKNVGSLTDSSGAQAYGYSPESVVNGSLFEAIEITGIQEDVEPWIRAYTDAMQPANLQQVG